MFKKATAAFAIIAAASNLVSAEVSFDTLNKSNIRQEIANLELSVPAAAPAAEEGVLNKSSKEWTIMVFINAKNNLER